MRMAAVIDRAMITMKKSVRKIRERRRRAWVEWGDSILRYAYVCDFRMPLLGGQKALCIVHPIGPFWPLGYGT